MSDLDKINSIFNAKIDTIKNKEELQNLKTEFFGKNGQITQQFKTLGKLEPDKRKDFASNLNKIKDDLSSQIEQKSFEIENAEISDKLKNEKVDVTLPIRPYQQGKIHPVSQVIDEISSIFSEIGFTVAEGPDVETEYNNFTALNTPEDHPARDMHDTFYLEKNKKPGLTVNFGGKIPGSINQIFQELIIHGQSKSRITHIPLQLIGLLKLLAKLKIIPVTSWHLSVMHKDNYYDNELLFSTGYRYRYEPINALKEMLNYFKQNNKTVEKN